MQIVEKPTGEIRESCDWLAFTVRFYQELTWPHYITTSWKTINPIARFTDGNENSQGIRLYWNKARPNMGKHIVLSGSCCTTIGANLRDLLQYVLAEGFSVTRLDLCVDAYHTKLRPERASKLIKKGEMRTHAKTAVNYSDALVGGYTQYVGKKSSSTYVRIYDKASEMGTKEAWIRIEISYGKRTSKSATEAYLLNNSVRGMVRHFVDFPKWRDWQDIFTAPQIETRYEHKTSNTRVWIMDTVTKSIAKEMYLEDDQQFYLSFLQRIREEYYALSAGVEEITF